MTRRKKDQTVYALGTVGQANILLEMEPNGVEFTASSSSTAKQAMRLGIHCLNSGLDENEIFKLLESRVV